MLSTETDEKFKVVLFYTISKFFVFFFCYIIFERISDQFVNEVEQILDWIDVWNPWWHLK